MTTTNEKATSPTPGAPQPMCEACAFWKRHKTVFGGRTSEGECRRRAPAYVLSQVSRMENLREETQDWRVFPATNERDWCGEFQPSREPVVLVVRFVRECCEVENPLISDDAPAMHAVNCQVLYRAWERWCEAQGKRPGKQIGFFSGLYFNYPQLTRTKPSDSRGEVMIGIRLKKQGATE